MMRYLCVLIAVFVCGLASAEPPPASTSTLRGTVTDPSAAVVPGAVVVVQSGTESRQVTTDGKGQYILNQVTAGNYTVRVTAKGFAPFEVEGYTISDSSVLDVQLTIATEAQTLTVQEEANQLTTEPSSNASAIVLREKDLEALSGDPDELAQQLQALAGPGAGPEGGEVLVDGFSGGNLPPKASIREVRINANPFSPEYDRPGFGRIEILTKPGSDHIRGQAFFQFNNESLNSRSPLFAGSTLPPYQQRFFGFNLGGPIKKQKASFGLDLERRSIDENAFILATTLDDRFNPQQVNQAVVAPNIRTSISPRLDYSINAANTLVLRYEHTRMSRENEGIGDFSLASRGYDQRNTENVLQLTETAVLSPQAINETRFQYLRTHLSRIGDYSIPALTVQGAFEGGGAQIGNSGAINSRWELANSTTLTSGKHTVKWGGRLRQTFTDDTSMNNFGGAYTFFGGIGPELDVDNQPIAGTSMQLTALERYRRTLLFLAAGYAPAEIRALGGGASQFSITGGTPAASVNQFDIGLFVNDDWRVRPNLTLSYGLRYETQTNISDFANFSPRVGIAWGIDGGSGRSARTVLRAGFGIFYDRIADSLTLQALRYNGQSQVSYFILNPNFYPSIPSIDALAEGQQPVRIQLLDRNLQAPRTYQASIGLDRQINSYARLSVQYIASRGLHLLRSRNINTPVDGAYPFGEAGPRLLNESTGFSRSNQIVFSPRINYKGLSLFGFYGLSYGKTDAEGQPADPYNLRAEWGPSSFADVRHRAVIGTSLPLPWKITANPFVSMSSGSPYNITIGRDLNGDTLSSERPALLAGLSAADCSGGNLLYATGFGCFNLSPIASDSIIGRNFARGPANFTVNLRLARTWSFGNRGESGMEPGPPRRMGGFRGGRGPGGGGPPPGDGPPTGMFGASSGWKYNLTLSVSAHNLLNNVNYSAPNGDLSSPFFGEYRTLAGFGPFGGGHSTYNRKVDLQLRFTF